MLAFPRVVPAAARRDERIRRFRPPGAAPVPTDRMMILEDRVERRPGGLDRVLAREERAAPGHRVFQQPLVRSLLARMILEQAEFPLLADELLADLLDAG